MKNRRKCNHGIIILVFHLVFYFYCHGWTMLYEETRCIIYLEVLINDRKCKVNSIMFYSMLFNVIYCYLVLSRH